MTILWSIRPPNNTNKEKLYEPTLYPPSFNHPERVQSLDPWRPQTTARKSGKGKEQTLTTNAKPWQPKIQPTSPQPPPFIHFFWVDSSGKAVHLIYVSSSFLGGYPPAIWRHHLCPYVQQPWGSLSVHDRFPPLAKVRDSRGHARWSAREGSFGMCCLAVELRARSSAELPVSSYHPHHIVTV